MALPCGRGFCQTHARSDCCAVTTTTTHTDAATRHRSHVVARAFDGDRELIGKSFAAGEEILARTARHA
jgi:hypothetical protein